MNMKKHFIIIAVVFLLLVAFLGAIYLIQRKSQNSNKDGLVNNEEAGNQQNSEQSIIKKINPTEKGAPLDEEGDAEIETTEEYSIVYYASDRSFFITVLRKPFYENRIMAEEKFVKKMNITKEEACKLNVVLTFFDSGSYDNYGLSFCPNGKEFDEIKGL